MKLVAPHDCYLPAEGEVAKGAVVDVPDDAAASLRERGWKAPKAAPKATPATKAIPATEKEASDGDS